MESLTMGARPPIVLESSWLCKARSRLMTQTRVQIAKTRITTYLQNGGKLEVAQQMSYVGETLYDASGRDATTREVNVQQISRSKETCTCEPPWGVSAEVHT